MAVIDQFFTIPRGATILPDNGRRNRLAGLPIPDDSGFALVGDADRTDRAARRAVFCAPYGDGFRRDVALAGPDFCGIVLDPACVREILFEFTLGAGKCCPTFVKNDGARTGRPLV